MWICCTLYVFHKIYSSHKWIPCGKEGKDGKLKEGSWRLSKLGSWKLLKSGSKDTKLCPICGMVCRNDVIPFPSPCPTCCGEGIKLLKANDSKIINFILRFTYNYSKSTCREIYNDINLFRLAGLGNTVLEANNLQCLRWFI